MEGLEAEFDRIYKELASDIFAYFNICFGANPAEDLTQEVFLRVWRQLQNGAAVESWRAWAAEAARPESGRPRLGQQRTDHRSAFAGRSGCPHGVLRTGGDGARAIDAQIHGLQQPRDR